jgi:hypothetical protein
MKRYNIFSSRVEQVDCDFKQIAIHIFRNFDKAIRILTEMAVDHRCIICDDLSLNFTSKASLADHLWNRHKKRTMEFVRDNIMILPPDALQRLIQHE